MNYFLLTLKRYAEFKGRSRRAEYWWFTLFNLTISWALILFGTYLFHITWLGNLFNLATLLPSIAVGVRRMHDVNKSGWFFLIPIYSLVLAVTEGTNGPNEYGPDPKGVTDVFDANPEMY